MGLQPGFQPISCAILQMGPDVLRLADSSDIALMNRLRKSKASLRALCLPLFRELGVEVSNGGGFQVKVFDATTVREPGKT